MAMLFKIFVELVEEASKQFRKPKLGMLLTHEEHWEIGIYAYGFMFWGSVLRPLKRVSSVVINHNFESFKDEVQKFSTEQKEISIL